MSGLQYWLAELDQYGNPTLVDGAHSDLEGVSRALKTYKKCGFAPGRRYAAAKIEIVEEFDYRSMQRLSPSERLGKSLRSLQEQQDHRSGGAGIG